MGNAPVSLSQALAAFTEVFSPRIVARVNDYDVRIAHFKGEHVWHVHEHTDEFFLVLDGRLNISLREDGRERAVSLGTGEIFVVPKGTRHRPVATLVQAENCKWAGSELPTAVNSKLGTGTLALVEGIATLKFKNGATVRGTAA